MRQFRDRLTRACVYFGIGRSEHASVSGSAGPSMRQFRDRSARACVSSGVCWLEHASIPGSAGPKGPGRSWRFLWLVPRCALGGGEEDAGGAPEEAAATLLAEPVAFPTDGDHVAVMEQPIVVGDGRCGPRVGRAQRCRRWFRAAARCRSETGVPGAALDRGWRWAVRQSRWHGAVSSALVSRSRAMPVGDRRSRPRGCSGLAMRDAAVTLAWRSVVGAGFALPRDAGRRPALQFPRLFGVGDARCGSHVGMAQRCRRWFRAVARCRSETGAPGPAVVWGWRCAMRQSRWHGEASSVLVSRCRAMPVGDRRSNSRACSGLAMRDAAVTLAGRSVVGAGFALPRDAGRRPALQFPRLFAVGDARCGNQVGRAQRCRRWFRAAARCRSETGAPGPALVCGWRCAVSRRCAPRCRSEDRRCLRFRRRGRRVRKGPRPRSRGECRRRRPPGRRRPGRSSRPAGGWRS